MGQILQFLRPTPDASPDAVADLLLALEAAPLFDPPVSVGFDRFGDPAVTVAANGRPFGLSPLAARLAAETLIAEQAFAACVGVAHALEQAAEQAGRMQRVR